MKIGFFGAGKMAEGILSAIADKSEVIMAEHVDKRARELERRYHVQTTDDVAVVAKKAKFIFLAVRPSDVNVVAADVKGLLTTNHVLVSIVAGKTLADLRRAFGKKVRLVRVMPNLALRVKTGMCAICGSTNARERDLVKVEEILGRSSNKTLRIDEQHFDAVTGLSGSGPAYFAYMLEAMMEGGMKLGLKPSDARLLAEQTMLGTAKFLAKMNPDIREFINEVCTKGGTTAAGMKELNYPEKAPEFKKIVARTLKAAAARSKELART